MSFYTLQNSHTVQQSDSITIYTYRCKRFALQSSLPYNADNIFLLTLQELVNWFMCHGIGFMHVQRKCCSLPIHQLIWGCLRPITITKSDNTINCKSLAGQFLYAPYKAGMYVHHMKNYQSSLLMLLSRLVHTFITQRITDTCNTWECSDG